MGHNPVTGVGQRRRTRTARAVSRQVLMIWLIPPAGGRAAAERCPNWPGAVVAGGAPDGQMGAAAAVGTGWPCW